MLMLLSGQGTLW
uniref:Uncharacterized protein n=1 Tax=Rhizophora mucronata TaxID=61149 RepID=A0A2P2PX25_RHIMU